MDGGNDVEWPRQRRGSRSRVGLAGRDCNDRYGCVAKLKEDPLDQTRRKPPNAKAPAGETRWRAGTRAHRWTRRSNARPGGSSTNGPVMTAGYGGASRSCQQQASTSGKHWPSLVASTSRWSGPLGWGIVRGRSLPARGLHSAAIALPASSSLASISPRRMRSISGLEILTSGGRTTARGMRPSRTRASFMRLCISTKGLA